MIILIVCAYCGIAACLLLLFNALRVLGEHKDEILKNRSCIQLLNQRYAELASMVALCPDDFNTNDFFEEVEHNEQ